MFPKNHNRGRCVLKMQYVILEIAHFVVIYVHIIIITDISKSGKIPSRVAKLALSCLVLILTLACLQEQVAYFHQNRLRYIYWSG